MIVTKETKISQIINENIDSIDTIASINKHFKKLKNPILRKVLASRVSVKEASKIGGTTINDFLQRLEKIGFEVVYEEEDIQLENTNFYDENLQITSLDVRLIIESGNDPFKQIMQGIKQLNEGEALQVINVFEPIPLIKILKSKNYKTWTNKISNEEFHTYFVKEVNSGSVESMPITEGGFDEKLAGFGGNIHEIDVRLLEMPEPMVNILIELGNLPDTHALLVNHKKVPQFLLPELKTRNYQWMSKEIEVGHIMFLIFK